MHIIWSGDIKNFGAERKTPKSNRIQPYKSWSDSYCYLDFCMLDSVLVCSTEFLFWVTHLTQITCINTHFFKIPFSLLSQLEFKSLRQKPY